MAEAGTVAAVVVASTVVEAAVAFTAAEAVAVFTEAARHAWAVVVAVLLAVASVVGTSLAEITTQVRLTIFRRAEIVRSLTIQTADAP